MKLHTVVARIFIAGLLSVFAGSAVAQQNYPSRTVRLIVAYAPTGLVDLVGRILAQKLGDGLSQQVLVDNRPKIAKEANIKAA